MRRCFHFMILKMHLNGGFQHEIKITTIYEKRNLIEVIYRTFKPEKKIKVYNNVILILSTLQRKQQVSERIYTAKAIRGLKLFYVNTSDITSALCKFRRIKECVQEMVL